MSIRPDGSTIFLEGECPADDAEVLARHLLDPDVAIIDWTVAGRLHTAVVQVVLAAGRETLGPCGDPFVARWVESSIVASRSLEM